MTHISREEVEHIAMLSRLELSPEDIDRFTAEFEEILAYVDQLNQLDVSDLEPTFYPIPRFDVMRPDETAPCLTVEEALANSPHAKPPFFQVPKVVDM